MPIEHMPMTLEEEPYSLLAVDPGSEQSAFLWTRVTPPEEWALPFGVEPQRVEVIDNASALETGVAFGGEDFYVAVEVLPGLFGGTSGADQLKADQFGHRLLGRLEGLDDGFALLPPDEGWRVYRATARSTVTGNATAKDGDVRRALIDIYGGEAKAIGGGRCRTCKKAEGWIGRDHADCPNCKAGHGDTGFERPRGVFHGWTGSHGWAALAVAIVAAQRIGR